MLPKVEFIDSGLIDYQKAWDLQEKLFKDTLDLKIRIRNGETDLKTSNYLIFCEHPHVFTLGKSGSEENLLLSVDRLEEINAAFYRINRGGDITYHGPGQLVAYPVFDLDYFFTDIHKYMRFLEESVIACLEEFGIKSGRMTGLTGVWIDPDLPTARKICAMGVKSSRWVTMHGIGFNVNTDLSYFSYIIPCGINGKAVTSMHQELGGSLNIKDVAKVLKEKMAQQFRYEYV